MTSLSIIGMGSVGKTLGFLFARAGVTIETVHSRSDSSAREGIAFIGQGRLASSLDDVEPADFLLVTTNDNALTAIAPQILAACRLKPGSIVLHCSGATPSDVLAPLRGAGVHVGSVHPVFSFPAPERDVERFAGTWCGVEGDGAAVPALEDLFSRIGAHPFRIDGERKSLYHASFVIACNYLVALMDAAMTVCRAAGVEDDAIPRILAPFVRGTLDNVFEMGPASALTGPIARGDHAVVEKQLAALGSLGAPYQALYSIMGRFAADLSGAKGAASAESLDTIRQVLGGAGVSAAASATGPIDGRPERP